MDAFDYREEAQVRSPRTISSLIWNVLTVLVLLLTLCVGGVFLTVFINPNIGLNPFPPSTLPAVRQLPTSTPTPRLILPPTWTPTTAPEPTQTSPPTLEPSPTEPPVENTPPATETLAPVTPPAGLAFEVLQGYPKAISNIGHPDLGCNWMGVAGQALDLNNASVTFLFVQLGGSLGNKTLEGLSLTGTATQYGPGGYEFTLGDAPVASRGTVWIQLFDQGMLPLSEKIYFDTYADCEKNLIYIYFKKVR